jgi:hypothetical protein
MPVNQRKMSPLEIHRGQNGVPLLLSVPECRAELFFELPSAQWSAAVIFHDPLADPPRSEPVAVAIFLPADTTDQSSQRSKNKKRGSAARADAIESVRRDLETLSFTRASAGAARWPEAPTGAVIGPGPRLPGESL